MCKVLRNNSPSKECCLREREREREGFESISIWEWNISQVVYFNYGLFILRGHNRSRYSAISQKTLPPSHYILYLHLYRINTQSMVPKKPKVYFALSCFDIIAGFDYASTSRVYKKKTYWVCMECLLHTSCPLHGHFFVVMVKVVETNFKKVRNIVWIWSSFTR